MTVNKTSLHDAACPESERFSFARDDGYEASLAGGLPLPARCWQMEFHSDESPYLVSGEQHAGVGSQVCDHETSTWHPRFASVNHALTRRLRAGR